MKTFLRYWLPPFAYCFLIFLLSSRSTTGVSHDKIAHTVAYAVMAFLFARAFSVHTSVFWKIWLFAFLISTFYGVSDEYHQSFVPGRHSSIDDVIADALGALIGGFVYVSLTRIPKLRSSNR